MSDVQKKVDFIIAWYNNEKIRFSFANRVILAKTWIDICTRNEEYEMAAALQKEKQKEILKHLSEKRKSRTYKQIIKFYFYKIKRKILR